VPSGLQHSFNRWVPRQPTAGSEQVRKRNFRINTYFWQKNVAMVFSYFLNCTFWEAIINWAHDCVKINACRIFVTGT
jgi:hypothetical protein